MATFALQGTFTALVTPFTAGGSDIDWPALERLVDDQIAAGVSGLVPCGTTGEAPTLSGSEKRAVIERVVQRASGRVPVLAGTGTNSTETSIEGVRAAVSAGADAVMVVMPYYNKPSQEGLLAHVRKVAGAVDVPVVLYNIPARTGVELSVESVLTLLDDCPNLAGVKDATGGVAHCQELLRLAGERVAVMCGDDPLTLPMMSVGAKGVISVTSNVYPKDVANVTRLALSGEFHEARKCHLALLPVHRVLFLEPNPQPTKAALEARGRMGSSVRLPLVPASAACRAKLAEVLGAYEAT